MKLNKEKLKTFIKESLEEMSHGRNLELVDRVTQDMIEGAILRGEDYLISRNFAAKIVGQHQASFEDAIDELGDKPEFTVSELFGWLGY